MSARRRDVRRYGSGPYLLRLQRDADDWSEEFPYTVLARLDDVCFDQPVTFLAGDNGTGKSTVVEACAEAMGFDPQGGELERLHELPAVPRAILGGRVEPVLNRWARPRTGYFLRAESFFNIATLADAGTDFTNYGDRPLHQQSHGQSFLALASSRFGGEGLFILDEPEAALSVTGALALLAVIARAAGQGAQFIVATHSPILLATPGARIYEFTEDDVRETAYDDLEAVQLTRGFLNAPERYLRAALGTD
jgi:predicted ATPase